MIVSKSKQEFGPGSA